MIYIVAFGGGLKCPRKIHLNTQFPVYITASPSRFALTFWQTKEFVNIKVLVEAVKVTMI